MKSFVRGALACAAAVQVAAGQAATPKLRTIAPEAMRFAEVINGSSTVVTHLGRRAIKLDPTPDKAATDEGVFAILSGSDLRDGTIEIAVSGKPRPTAPSDSRGFVGIAFRVTSHGEASELFYLRPTNGRTDDQARRNHTVQYVSPPEFTWERLRKESPSVYESYVDIQPGVWTTMKIVIAGTKARLYVNGATQPTLIVNDLKRGNGSGSIALWAHVETEGYFGAMTIGQ